MALEARPAPAVRSGSWSPFRLVWDLLTNVKFALLLVSAALLTSLVGVVVPQMPAAMRDNPAARQAWLDLQREDYGALTDVMDRLRLFEMFATPWFIGMWVVITIAVTVCTVSRLRPTARSIHRPPRAVPDRYFETARYRAATAAPVAVETVAATLRAQRYTVVRVDERGDETRLFADRYPWASYGTFVSHLALLILLVGGVLTMVSGFDETLALAETTSPVPVFREPGPGQIFVRMVDAVEGVDERGNIVDYRSLLEIRRGNEVVECVTTVNDPCGAFGYRFHQAAFFDDVARISITGPDGRLLYDDVVDFDNEATLVPVIRVESADGQVLWEQDLPQMGTDTAGTASRADDLALAELAFETEDGPVRFDFAWRVVRGELQLVAAATGVPPVALEPGATLKAAGVTLTRAGTRAIPAREIADLPGARGRTVVQMPSDRDGNAYLFITGIDAANAVIPSGGTYTSTDGYTYAFSGQVEAAGINIRRDPGDTFIWVAVGMAMVGLGITFYVPKRRVWVKVTPERALFAGIAEKTARLDRELARLAASLDASARPAGPGRVV